MGGLGCMIWGLEFCKSGGLVVGGFCGGNRWGFGMLSYCFYHGYRLSAFKQYAVGRRSESSLSSSTINTFQ